MSQDRYADITAGACIRSFNGGPWHLCEVCGHDASMHPNSSETAAGRVYCVTCAQEAYLRETRAARDAMLEMLEEFKMALTRFYEYIGVFSQNESAKTP